MYNILTLNAISPKGLNKLPSDEFCISDKSENPDGIIVRSADMHSYELPKTLLAIARAGAGTNNIPSDKCAEKGVVVFNTPGANANAVKELVICGLLLSSRKVVEAYEWTKTLKGQPDMSKLVEAGKKKFAGPEILGKKLGVLGLGAVGVQVANAAVALGMKVVGYDPFLSLSNAWHISCEVCLATTVEKVFEECDYVTIHIPQNPSTIGMFNKEVLSHAKKGCRLLNFSRGGLVVDDDIKAALEDGTLAKYVTDFASETLLGLENVIALPHLGASTPESEENCAVMAALEVSDFLKYGNIKNSVNYPNCEAPYTGKARVTIAHKNIPNMVGSITSTFAKYNLNIDNMINKSKGNWAYTIIDLDTLDGKNSIANELGKLNGVVKARIVREN
ncbi:MAG: phosphoglycerate dehydrogenase [Clostridia bacterium]|jgi:D-3-phosphoglycerate dehydrogenase|nr:phosphoglycerate dehydrogenase [Clostridia bacterium]